MEHYRVTNVPNEYTKLPPLDRMFYNVHGAEVSQRVTLCLGARLLVLP